MIRLAQMALMFLAIAALVPFGCGGRRRPTPGTPGPAPPPVSTVDMGGSTIAVDDPAGRWKLRATSPHVLAEGIGGPFRLEPATCRYQQQGHPPVLMRAATAVVDKTASRVILEGQVEVVYGALTLEGERIEYDLNRGEVVAGDRTKLTYAEPRGSSRSWPSRKNGGPR